MAGRWPRQAARRATGASALLALLSLGSVLHYGVVEHDLCEEHGVLVERGVAGHHDGPEGAEGPSGDPDVGDGGHEHCPVLAHEGRPQAGPVSLIAPFGCACAAEEPVERVAVAHPPVPVLAVAPKTSPPA